MTQADDIRELKRQIEDLRKELSDVRRQVSWFTGALMGAGLIVGFFTGYLKEKLGLPK